MLYLIIILVLLLFSIVWWFVNPKLSPIPYYPTLGADLTLIDKALNLRAGDILYDLGAGDGKMLWRYAKRNIKVMGVEINPFLVLLMLIRRWFHHQRQQIRIIWRDLFKTDLTPATHIYLFVGPFLIDKIFAYILNSKSPKLRRIVSYRYQPKLPHPSKTFTGKQQVYIWEFKKDSSGLLR